MVWELVEETKNEWVGGTCSCFLGRFWMVYRVWFCSSFYIWWVRQIYSGDMLLQSILVGLSLAMQDFPSMWPVAIHSSNEGVWEGRIARVDSRSNKRPRNWGWLRWRVQYLEIQKLKEMRVKSLHKMITKCLVTQSPGESALLSTCTVEDNVSTQQWYANKIKEVYNFRNILPVGFFVNPSQTLKLACLIGKFQIFWSRMSRFCCFVKPGLTTNRYLMQ